MADISKITLPSGTTYDIKDAVAREAMAGGMHFLGVTTTALTDGSSTNPITIGGNSVTAVAGDIVLFGSKEFVFSSTDSKWHEFGDQTGLGDLAFKDTASGSFTPQGTVSTPTISVKTAGATTTVNSITDVGSLPALTMTVANEILTIGWDAGALPTKGSNKTVKTGDAAYQSTQPTFTGTAGTVTVS